MIKPLFFEWPLRVYYEDTDAGGIVYYANYLKFFERARTEWLRLAGVNQQEMAIQHKAMFVIKSAFVDYHSPARLDDELRVKTHVEKPGRASLVFIQEAWHGDQLLVEGRFKVGCVNTETKRPYAMPSYIVEAIQLQYSPACF